MLGVLVEERFPEEVEAQLQKEFPQCNFHYVENLHQGTAELSEKTRMAIEVVLSHHLSQDFFEYLPHLRWVDYATPAPPLLNETLDKQSKNLLVTFADTCYAEQTAEYLWTLILSLAKNLSGEEKEIWEMRQKTFLQVGLHASGNELVRLASEFNLKAWGIAHKHSFHPYCKKTFSAQALHSLLPHSDIVSFSLSDLPTNLKAFSKEDLSLIKEDAILLLHATPHDALFREDALQEIFNLPLRGKILHSFSPWPNFIQELSNKDPCTTLLPSSFYKKLPQSPLALFRHFRNNLRAFLRGKIEEMKTRVPD